MRRLLATALLTSRVLRRSQARAMGRPPRAAGADRPCIVVGNGPSLATDAPALCALRDVDVFCVNQFAESDLFEVLRPSDYVLADPDYWGVEAHGPVLAARERLLMSLRERTTWPMRLHVPAEGADAIAGRFVDHPRIAVLPFNATPVPPEAWFADWFLDQGLGSIRAQNVLASALYLALRMGYRGLVVVGADHSWIEGLRVDGDNRLLVQDRHFYDPATAAAQVMHTGSASRPFTIGAYLHALAHMFDSYHHAAAYAERRGARILNASSRSFIDAFPRRGLEEAVASLRN